MAKRALILQGGTMKGAFMVGAIKTIHRLLGVNYFDAIFSSSVGIFEQVFFATNQPDVMEKVWRDYVDGRKLINFINPIKKRGIVDLDYLVKVFQSDGTRLDLKALEMSSIKLLTLVTDYQTRKLASIEINNTNIFDLMRATCALPYLYPKPVIIDGKRYIDGIVISRSEFNSFLSIILKDYDEVFAVTTKNNDSALRGIKNIIRPSKNTLWNVLDTNRGRLIKTIRQGEIDTEKFILENNLVK
jgi:predicted patatin/cPLA2 family phospholipase